MRIAVTSTGPSLDSMISPTCAEATHFVFMNLASGQFYAFEIPSVYRSQASGFPIVESLLGSGICVVLMQACKPEVQRALQGGSIRVYTQVSGTVSEGIEKYRQGWLLPASMLPKKMQMR